MSAPRPQDAFLQSELGLRVASAIVLLIIVLGSAWAGGPLFAIVCASLSALMFYEWERLTSLTPFDMPEALLTAAFGFFILAALAGFPFAGLIVLLLTGLGLEMTTHGDERSDVRWVGLGAIYCAIPVFALPVIREEGGLALLLFLFITVWVTDIAAYFAGRAYGGAKLMPSVSPKKTWSGAAGGLFAAIVAAFVFSEATEALLPLAAILLAVLLSIASQAGDLFESWVKRRFDVKDSSGLIPGHGGFLDRVDGLVAAAVPMGLIVLLSIR